MAAMGNFSPMSRALTLIFLGLVLLLGASMGSRPLIHDDLFFHLATGQFVVENFEVPTTDLFSFTRGGEPWVSHEWGFGVLTHSVWSSWGYRALVILKATVTVAILLALFVLMKWRSGARASTPNPGLVALLAVGLWAISDELILRASLVSSLFILILMGLLLWFDRRGGPWPFASIALLFLFWGNFHGEVLFGLFLLGVATVEAALARWRPGIVPSTLLQANKDRPYLFLFAVSLLLTLVNPNGIQVLLYPFRLAWFLFTRGDSLEMGHFTGATPVSSAGFYLLVAILLIGILPLQRLKALSLTEVLTVGAFFVLSVKSHRFIFFFTLFVLPVATKLLGERFSDPATSKLASGVRGAVIGLAMLATAVAAAGEWRHLESNPVSPHFPSGAVAFLEENAVGTRGFNHQNYGGYLHWTLDQTIFWDGRNLLFDSLMEEVAQMPLEEVVDTWKIDYLLLTEFEYRQMGDQIDPADWALVHWDDFAALYLNRDTSSAAFLEKTELRQLPPFGGVDGLNLLAQDAARTAFARGELDQVLRFQPDCQRALYLHGLLSFYSGDLARSETELRRALALGPNPFVEKALVRTLGETAE
jgi:hypothetical protein